MTYRPALDGVRALAVLAIIVFHTTTVLPGGFMGIDVFFVLSGYLITTLLLRERVRAGRIRLGQFWARRARRLLPALLVVVTTVALADWLTAPIERLDARRGDLLASLLYYANWHFVSVEENYFAIYQGASPLRHIWSLAVEEQYYLLWPLLLIGLMALLAARLRPLPAVSAGGAALSAVAMAALYDPAYPERAYFGTDARAHQLLIGAALAVLMQLRPSGAEGPRARRLAIWMGPLAAAAAAAAVLLVHEDTRAYYYGGSLLFAVAVATALWSLEIAPRAWLGRLLSLPALVWIGLISYGLYLWHWPLVVWLRDVQMGTHTRQALVWAGTLLLATLSYYLMERPVREGRLPWVRFSARRLALAVVLALGLGVGVSLAATRLEGGAALLAKADDDRGDLGCPDGSPAVHGRQFCALTKTSSARSPVVAIVGDSTSRALDAGVRVVARRRGWGYVLAGQDGCPLAPLLLRESWEPNSLFERRRACPREISALVAAVSHREHPDVWIVSDLHGIRPIVDRNGHAVPPSEPRHWLLFRAAMRRTLSGLAADGAQVLVVASPPQAVPAKCVDDPGDDTCKSSSYTRGDPLTGRLDREYRTLARELPRVTVVSIADLLCPRNVCPLLMHGRVPRWDGIHLTAWFSRRVAPTIVARAEHAGVRFRARRGESG